MSNGPLSKVIDDLRQHGLAAGQEEGARELAEAREQADALVDAARQEANQIVARAEEEAKALKKRLEVELKLSAAGGVVAFERALQASLVVPPIERAVAGFLDDPRCLTELLVTATKAMASGRASGVDLDVLVSERHRDALEGALLHDVCLALGEGVTVRFDRAIDGGFYIVLRDRAYRFEFTRAALEELLATWMTPRLRRHLFAEA